MGEGGEGGWEGPTDGGSEMKVGGRGEHGVSE